MTGIQVQYWANVETARSHRANEYLEYMGLLENKRHNQKTEDINTYNAQTQRMSLLESARHNQQDESIRWATLDETVRTHKENESINWFNAYETERSHKVNEAVNWFNAYETQRTHQVNEAIGWFNAYESQRTHKANEAISWFSAQEMQRSHLEGERISWANLALTERDVTTRENAQLTREAELAQTRRHQERQDAIAAYANTIREMEYNLDYSKWYGKGGYRDTEIAKQSESAAKASYAEAQTEDLHNKAAGTGVYWDTQEWLDYSKIISNYLNILS